MVAREENVAAQTREITTEMGGKLGTGICFEIEPTGRGWFEGCERCQGQHDEFSGLRH